ncbi:hypothetical protein BSKO_09059 [Bryopsis sp. KO-2023]|nr:hypothetical protein BSKO_09059 [Bryopsis sp. KO-2023]
MSPLVFGLLLLGVASAQDALSVSVKPINPGGGGFGPGPCPDGQQTIACTASIPPSCTCGPVIGPRPKPFPINPVPIDPFPRPCACFALYDPVCGRDGRTYGNSCEASCSKTKVACQGRCPCPRPRPPPPQGCVCGAVFSPVCGTDGRTYSNDCEARCAGVGQRCNGGCPCNRPSPPSTPSTPTDINNFLDECVRKGEAASVAAARAACSTVLRKCPVSSPRLAFGADAAGLAKASSAPNPADALLEKVLEGACLVEAENACRSKAFDNISNSSCRRVLNSGPAQPAPRECPNLQAAVRIFNGDVDRLCKRK